MTFPTTPIIDDFNRADEGPPPSLNWDNAIAWFGSSYQLVTKNGACRSDSPYPLNYTGGGGAFWKTRYAVNQEVYYTISAVDIQSNESSRFVVYARLDSYNNPTIGYDCSMAMVNSNPGQIEFLLEGFNKPNLYVTYLAGTLSAGDKFGLHCEGATIDIYYKPVNGSMTLIHSFIDGTPILTAGYIGIEHNDSFNDLYVSAISDFGGGSFVQDSDFIEIAIANYINDKLSDSAVLVDIKAFVRGLLFKPVQNDLYPLIETVVATEDGSTLLTGGVYTQTLHGMILISIMSQADPDRPVLSNRQVTLPTFTAINHKASYIIGELSRAVHHDMGDLTTSLSLGDVTIDDTVIDFRIGSARAYNVDQVRENDWENTASIPFEVDTHRIVTAL